MISFLLYGFECWLNGVFNLVLVFSFDLVNVFVYFDLWYDIFVGLFRRDIISN